MSRTADLIESTRPLRERLLAHPLYDSIKTPGALRIFMEHHVFAVWDFMTLLKSLQRSLTCVDLPWVPTLDAPARRLVNEIVLAEESDEDGLGGFSSHFESYLDAMRQAGADPSPAESFVEAIRRGSPIDRALEAPEIPPPAAAFVRTSWGFVESGSVAAVASAFTLGREDLIPDLFRGLVVALEAREPGLARFRYYLDRHIVLDSDDHGPKALRMLEATCGSDPIRWRDAQFAAVTALDARLALWDGILAKLHNERAQV